MVAHGDRRFARASDIRAATGGRPYQHDDPVDMIRRDDQCTTGTAS